MAELDTEHVRMLDAGRQRVAYSSPFTSNCFDSVASKKTQLLQHGNIFGLSFVAIETGFAMTDNKELEKSCNDYNKRRQEAMDHGEKLTMDEIHELPVAKEVQLPSIAYWIALSQDELTLAVAYGDSVALFEVAHIKEAAVPAPFHTFSKMQAQEIMWSTGSASEELVVLTLEKKVVVCTLEGEMHFIDTQTDAASISWSPSGEQIAVGLVDGSIAIYARKSLEIVRSIGQPQPCAELGLEAHHVNWAEEELIMVGYQKYDEENEETSALACIFDKDECVELDEVVAFFDVEGRQHQYFSVFLPDWRMFFISCSLSADIELLVSDPDGGEWQLWKPLEKYQARLPMNAEDGESFPMGFALNLNSTTPVPVEEDSYPPVPIISCTNTEGLLVNFSFVDTTVNEVDFVKIPSPFEQKAIRATNATSSIIPEVKAEVVESPKKIISHEYGQDADNEFADSDGESSDEEEERKEEEENARVTFRTMAADGTDYIASDLFPKLFKAMGSTYDEDVHASTVASLEKDGKIYEADFVSWYVDWIFGPDDSDSEEEDDAPAPSEAKPAEMKSKEEIAAAFSKFTAKEGSWKCAMCMINNDREAVKCSSCETPNPAAPKVVAPVTAASATSAGSIGSGGFSFPVSSGDASKTSSFSFGAAPSTDSKAAAATKPTGFSFGGAATSGFNFSNNSTSSSTGFNFPSSSKASTGFSFEPTAVKTAASSAYPPDTTSKPKPPSFGAASGAYPPDTTSKPKPPSFGAASGAYPPDTTSKPKPPPFGQSMTTSTNKTAPSSSSSFGSFGKSQFGSNQDSSTSTEPSATKTNSFFGNGFGSNGTAEKVADTSSSPFGVVPSAKSKSAFSFGSTSATAVKAARPSFSFDNVPTTLESTGTRGSLDEQPRTKRTLNFGDVSLSDATTNSVSSSMVKPATSADPSKGIPSSRMEGQLWKLIIDFHKSLERVNTRSKTITSKDGEFSKKLIAQVETIRARISSLCDEINSLDESRDQIEKNVLFVIGSDGDVHEQLEYGREILSSFKDEALKRTLEEQPLDQRSKETWESLKDKLAEVEKSCFELSSHLSSSKIGVDGAGAVSSAHLFRVLKQTYDNSKMQYNNACKLAENLEKLNLCGDRLRETNGVNGISGIAVEAHPMTTKADMVQMIVETEQRSQDVRRNFLSLCNNVVTPRDVFSTPRRKLAPPTPSNSSNSPLRVKACSKLMPKTQLSVASPMSSAKQSLRSVSFKDTPVKSGSKLFTLAEAMAPKEEPAKLVKTPQPTPLSVGVGKAPQRPSLGAPASENKSASTNSATSAKSNIFSLPKSGKETSSALGECAKEEKTTSTTTSFGGFGVNSPPEKSKRKADGDSAPSFSLGGKEPPAASSAFSFGSKSSAQPLSTTSATTDYKALLENFYKVHNPSKTGSVLDKALTKYKGKEEDLFTRIFTMYVPESTPDDIKKYLSGGPVPPKSETVVAASKSPAPANTAAKSLFGGFGATTTTPKDTAAKPSPFSASPSAFSLGPAANSSSGFGGFGSSSSTAQPTTMTPTAFGQPAVDYRQKLVEFYQKHNPDKLGSVDATLQKYKGNEEKLFQNLAVKYKLNGATGGVPASPAVQPSKPNVAASPFGKPGAFAAPSTSTGAAFGSTSSVGFGASKPAPSASPFGAPASSPFGTTTQSSSGFGSSGGSGFGGSFQSTSATTPAFGAPTPFGAAAGGFGASAGGVNYREKLTAFYQQHNPTKLSSVDATLEKYKGRENHLFAMLEQKYLKKTPTTTAAGGFGIPSTSTFGGGSGFGAPAALGSASAAPAFGSASTLGGTAQPAFGGAAGSGFGMASQMGGGFGSAAPAVSSGGATGSGFSSFGSQNPSFGGAAQQTGGFGAAANTGGFGSGFGGAAAAGGFGQPTAFNSSSFTQMR